MKLIFTFFFLYIYSIVVGQINHAAYKHFSIYKNKDTINYHIYSKEDFDKLDGFVLYIQGSGAAPFFTIRKEGDAEWVSRSVPNFDFVRFSKKIAFVVISKKCIPFSVTNKEFKIPNCFYEYESLDYRVWQADEAIKNITNRQIRKSKKVIVIGHSEGSDVVAKLGTKNKSITHIGYWAGGGNSQYYDFALFIRKEVAKGNLSEAEALKQLDSLATKLKEIETNRNSITDFWEGHTFKRWTSFSEPPIENLLKIKVPIFVAVGAKDESVPIESSYLIQTEFIRHKKNNLTFRVYPDYDHSFQTVPVPGKEERTSHWKDIFDEFIKWTEQ
jgi:esterase/lipase/ribosomal protein L19